MKKIILTSLIILVQYTLAKAGDLNSEIVDLAKIYRSFMFGGASTESAFKQIDNLHSEDLVKAKKFIKETITTKNNLATVEFLTPPDDSTLKYIYIIRRVSWNLSEKTPRDNNELIAELTGKEILKYEFVDSYYSMLFDGIGNKNQPFDLSASNFELFSYGLKDDTEKGIFFLQAMDLCGMQIFGYMNIVNPPNYKLALENIEKYPQFNGQAYYHYLDFSFPDFVMEIEKDKGEESYKHYYINKYYNTLLSHLACLSQKKKQEEARTELLLGSILREENYYEYSKQKKILESLFKEIKQ